MFGEKILDYWDDILRDLKEIIAVPSVAVPQAGPYPFGKDAAAAIDKAMELCARYDLTAKNCDYYAMHAEIGEGKTGAAMMAIRTGVPILPVYIDPERKAFRRTRVYIGEPYLPFPEKRRANAEDYEVVTEEIMNRIRAVRDHRAEMEAAE